MQSALHQQDWFKSIGAAFIINPEPPLLTNTLLLLLNSLPIVVIDTILPFLVPFGMSYPIPEFHRVSLI